MDVRDGSGARGLLRGMLGLGMLAGPLSGVAGAESYVPPCDASWWVPRHGFPTSFEGMPAQPTVLLPAVWAEVEGVPPGGELFDAVTVVVKPVGGEPVEGELKVGIVDAQTSAGYQAELLARQLSWRAARSLAPGIYEVTLAVADAPDDYGWECYYEAFERKVTFEVAAEPPPAPALEVAAKLVVKQDSVVEYGTSCERQVQNCEGAPGACCWYEPKGPEIFTMETSATASGLSAGGPFHHVLLVERAPTVGWATAEVKAVHPVTDGTTLKSIWHYIPAMFGSGTQATELCVSVDLVNLAGGGVVATGATCMPTADAEPAETLPALVCEAEACSAALNGSPPVEVAEPGPEESAELDPEPMPEPGPEADAGDATTTTPDPEGPRNGGADGCAGGAGGGALVVLGVLGALLWWRRREMGAQAS